MEHKNNAESTQLTESIQCHDLLGNLSEFIDGTLKEELCNQIRQHMQGCENCRIVVDTLRKTVNLYQATAAQSPVVPEEVRERLYHSLALDEFLNKS
jgi:anti-sigma factor (TIGR02949 family)